MRRFLALFVAFVVSTTGCNGFNKPTVSITGQEQETEIKLGVYPVSVDYGQSLADMIEAGNYDQVAGITADKFPVEGNGTEDVNLRLIHVGYRITTEAALAKISALGFQPAKIEHLLAFGAKYPEKQQEFSIVALGSVRVGPVNDRNVVFLEHQGPSRLLWLKWVNHQMFNNMQWVQGTDEWEDTCRFLVVSK